MARLDFRAALDLLEDCRTVAICGHVNPDGDAIGSVLGLTAILRRLGYSVTPLLATHDKPRPYDFLEGYEDLVPACQYHAKPDVFISVDVPNLARTADGAHVFKRAAKTIAIDHHQGPADFADVNLVDETAAAAGMLIWDFAVSVGLSDDAAIATCCYTALVTDTGRFQYQNADGRALEAASAMTQAGACPADIARFVYQRMSRAALELRARAVQRMELICDGRAVISYVTQADFEELSAEVEDGESLVDCIRQLDGVEVVAMLRDQGPVIRGSLRAKDAHDVSAIARRMNGGGHRAAAGFTLKLPLDKARAHVAKLIEESFAVEAGADAPDGAADADGSAR